MLIFNIRVLHCVRPFGCPTYCPLSLRSSTHRACSWLVFTCYEIWFRGTMSKHWIQWRLWSKITLILYSMMSAESPPIEPPDSPHQVPCKRWREESEPPIHLCFQLITKWQTKSKEHHPPNVQNLINHRSLLSLNPPSIDSVTWCDDWVVMEAVRELPGIA